MAPNQRRPGVRQHNVWLDEDLASAAKAKAAREGVSISAVIRAALEAYIAAEDHPN